MERYDVIVVGAGSAGCALAARLSEDSGRSVLLVEAGPRFVGVETYPPELKYASSFAAGAPGHRNNWGHTARLTAEMQYPVPRGRVVGGSSAINGTVFTRGLAEDFDGWAQAGHTAWSYDAVLPFFRKLERDLDRTGGDHGADGPMAVRRVPREAWTSVSAAFVEACEAAGFPSDPDMNGPGSIGVGALPLNNVGGLRFNTGLAFLDPILDRSNLRVLPGTMVRKLIVADGRATGIAVQRDGEISEIGAGEVVLSAGAINSPHLLMLSGIGPAEQLARFDIPVVHEMPHVGRNFTDHCTIHFPLRIPARMRRDFDPAITPFSEVGLHYTTPGSDTHSDMMLMQNAFPLNAAVLRGASFGRRFAMLANALRHMSWTKLKDQMTTHWDVSIAVILMTGRSRGEIRLTSADPMVTPMLDYHYLEDPEDRWRLREGMRLAARLVSGAAFRRIGARPAGPDADALASDDLLDAYVRAHVSTSAHTASTCRMGASREDSVVDQYCRVHGITGLRVIDTSIMPTVVRRCPNATAVMIGERAAEFF